MTAAGAIVAFGVGVCLTVAVHGAATGSLYWTVVGVAGLLYTLWGLVR